MKKLFLILCLIFTPAIVFGGTCWNGGSSGTSPWDVLDGSGGNPSLAYADVNYCVNTIASSGDTVTVPSGSSTWSTQLVITKALTLAGQTTCTKSGTAGSAGYSISCDAGTVITAGTGFNSYLIKILPTIPADNPSITISGFVLDGDNTTGQGGGIQISNDSATSISNIRIHDNKIQNVASRYGLYIFGFVYGLVDNNHFHNIGDGVNSAYLFRYDGECHAWAATYPDYGSANFLYFENNYTTEIGYILDDSGTGARWVWRYNTMDISVDVPQKYFDLHEDVSNCGGIATEIYENSVSGTTTGVVKWAQVGMYAIIYNNLVGCESNSCKVQLGFAGQTTCVNYADASYQAYVDETYFWNNIYSVSGLPNYLLETDGGDCFAEDVEYWTDTDASPGGESPHNTNPEGYGNFWYDTAAQRPGSCSDNDSYWETDNKKLYRCVGANNWTLIYIPYTYPHPLRGAAAATPNITGVTITSIQSLLELVMLARD